MNLLSTESHIRNLALRHFDQAGFAPAGKPATMDFYDSWLQQGFHGEMEYLVRHLIGDADVTKALVFDDQYISTGGQFYELIVGHDRFNADLRPLFYRIQDQPPGLCCHPYDCATWLVAEEAGVSLSDGRGGPLDGPLDVTTGLSWAGYANGALREKIEPLLSMFLRDRGV